MSQSGAGGEGGGSWPGTNGGAGTRPICPAGNDYCEPEAGCGVPLEGVDGGGGILLALDEAPGAARGVEDGVGGCGEAAISR